MAVFPSLHRLLTQFLRLAAILLATFFATARAADTQRGAKPNIIFLLIDALGFADCGFNGGKDIRTPNIDRLAHGVRFSIRSTCSRCARPFRIADGTGVPRRADKAPIPPQSPPFQGNSDLAIDAARRSL